MYALKPFRALVAALLAVVCVVVTTSASAQQDGPALAKPESQQNPDAQFETAKGSFKPVSEEELAKARSTVEARMRDVERFVRPNSENGRRWLRYLRWDDFKNALDAKDAADFRALATTNQRLNRDANGLELKQFRELTNALQRYMQLAQIAAQRDQVQYYNQQLDRLRAQLEEYRNNPTDTAAFQIGSRLAFIEAMGGAKDLAKSIRREFVRPNAFMTIATALIAEGADPINRREPVYDCILGTSIRSDAHTRGRVGVKTIPSEDKAIIEFISEGHTFSRNVGNNGPAVIRSTADTNFTATKRVSMTDPAFT
jgi:hypothetical protein